MRALLSREEYILFVVQELYRSRNERWSIVFCTPARYRHRMIKRRKGSKSPEMCLLIQVQFNDRIYFSRILIYRNNLAHLRKYLAIMCLTSGMIDNASVLRPVCLQFSLTRNVGNSSIDWLHTYYVIYHFCRHNYPCCKDM